jgi:hypothetical protein
MSSSSSRGRYPTSLMKYPLYLQHRMKPKIQNIKPAGRVYLGMLAASKSGISSENASRWTTGPHIPVIQSPRAPRFSSQRIANRMSDSTKPNGVSYDAPVHMQIPYVRVHTPPVHVHKHRTLPFACRPGAAPSFAIGNLPAYHITKGMLAHNNQDEPRKTWRNRNTFPVSPNSLPRTPRPRIPRSPRTLQPPQSRYDYDETNSQHNTRPGNLSNTLMSPLYNRIRTESMYPRNKDVLSIESGEDVLLQTRGYTKENKHEQCWSSSCCTCERFEKSSATTYVGQRWYTRGHY